MCVWDTEWHWLVFARTHYEGPQLTNLVDIMRHVKPTALLGLSTLKAPP